jgi:DNA-binding cell septation regulator SpoVG
MNDKISEVEVTPLRVAKDGLVAMASCVYEGIHLGCIGIVTRPLGGYRLTYPTRRVGLQSFSIYHPLNKQLGSDLEAAIIGKYEQLLAKSHEDIHYQE